MHRWTATLIIAATTSAGLLADQSPADRAQRGALAVHGKPALNPALWSRSAYDNAWKQWGCKEKPADYDRAFRERYGLHQPPYENHGLPMGLHEAPRLLGKGITNDCLLCHAGSIAGQTYIGLGNASIDVQTLFMELADVDGIDFRLPFQFSHTRGTIDPITPTNFMMHLRDPNLNLRPGAGRFTSRNEAVSDPPAWWLLKRKKTRDWTGVIDARSARVDMVNLLNPLNGGDYVKKQEPVFKDIHAFLLSIEAPRYPFPIDRALAAQGQQLFSEHCARCHGSYGPAGKYPNKIVPLDEIGTDPTLAESAAVVAHYNESWLAQETGPDGKPYQFTDHQGYQAPPLDGIWATAPYFHNGSAPTLYHVLNSKSRPRIFTRSFRTEKEDYDTVKVGWKITVLERAPAATVPAAERRKVYDTTQPGRGNGGHTFGDDLSEEQRLAVLEYLKTL
jgi:mono/diheme cytochrome c family protein